MNSTFHTEKGSLYECFPTVINFDASNLVRTTRTRLTGEICKTSDLTAFVPPCLTVVPEAVLLGAIMDKDEYRIAKNPRPGFHPVELWFSDKQEVVKYHLGHKIM